MPSIAELSGAKTDLAASLADGVRMLSGNQTISFTKYVLAILPLDGFRFWVKSSLLSETALTAAGVDPANPDAVVTVQGSLHYASDSRQLEDESPTINQVVFTSLTEIQEFNEISPDVIYIGEFDEVRFAFSRRNSFYKQADLHHYVGDAIYPVMESQIIDSLDGFDEESVVVSNSLPVWMSLNQLMPVYPSFLVPENIRPPYASVHIDANATKAIQSTPSFGPNGTHYQLVSELVKVTIYGLRNDTALDYQDYVFNYMLDDRNLFGLMNMPVIRDEKRTQQELNILAMKKSIEFEVSYYQQRVKDIAIQLILTVIPNFFIGTDQVITEAPVS